MTTVRDIGETALIERLTARVSGARLDPPALDGFELLTGIGDDAAVWRLANGLTVTTTDTMVEGTHFTPETASWSDVGWKLWTANVSDVAAMGGTPLAGVVTLGLPSATPLRAVDDLYDGMLDACRAYRTLLAGGDIVDSPTAFFTVAMSGACTEEPLARAGGRAGEVVAVTGPLGASAAGLRLLLAGR
ncbi:MAG: thiamine-monophosphate kinase, partial [Chloroflexi bacterium]|nr:thiamine-monophosphate kinase [Chloroflexota bacterium]